MSEATLMALGRDAIVTVLLVSGPMVGLGLLVGLVVSLLMATTQIQEQTLAFVPKILAVFLAMLLFGSWMMRVMLDFANRVLANLTAYIG
ncbi:MAG TPA: flagellar biosynthesis protein FliQ [Limnochordales bacterium]